MGISFSEGNKKEMSFNLVHLYFSIGCFMAAKYFRYSRRIQLVF